MPLSDEINAHSNPNQTSLNQTHSRVSGQAEGFASKYNYHSFQRKRSSDEITGVQIVNRTESTQKMSLRYEADFMANPVVVLPFEEQSELYNNQDFLSSE